MRAYHRLILGVSACLVMAGGALFWAMIMMESIYNFRSPLHVAPPPPAGQLGEPLTRRLVFVLVDALREDTSLRPEVMPFLDQLRQQGAWATMRSRPPSYSQPAYTVLFRGAWPDLSDGPVFNVDFDAIPTWTQDNLISAAHRAGLNTAISAFDWFEKLVPREAIAASFYTPDENQAADRQVVDMALRWLADSDTQLLLIHLDQVDYAGHHEGGPRDPRWDAAARRVDDLLREIVASLDLAQDTLLIASDHGQVDQGGHGGYEPITLTEPFVLTGRGVRPGRYDDVNMVDVAPTLAALLGTNLPASSQGQVLTEMLVLEPSHLRAIQEAWSFQQEQLTAAYQAAIGQPVSVPPNEADVGAYQAAIETARLDRLQRERLPRAALALLLGSLPAIVAVRKIGRPLTWYLGGALVYVLVFNLRYVVLDRLTYSFSWVNEASQLILYIAVTALVALVVGWLAALTGLQAWKRGPRLAVEATLGYLLTLVYLLALPVLWSYVLNGAVFSWTLPDFPPMFLALFALIQMMLVVILGLFLAGFSALIARFFLHH